MQRAKTVIFALDLHRRIDLLHPDALRERDSQLPLGSLDQKLLPNGELHTGGQRNRFLAYS